MHFLKLPNESWASFISRGPMRETGIPTAALEKREQIYEAFGDATSGQSGTYYGFMLVPAERVREAENILTNVKIHFGGVEASRLHCREIFGVSALQKSAWAHLNQAQVIELCGSALDEFRTLGVKYALGAMPIANYPRRFRLRGREGHADIVHDIDDKWRELWTYHRAAMMLDPVSLIPVAKPTITPSRKNQPWWRMQAQLVKPGFKVSKVYLDNESTKVSWFSKRFQWQTIARDFVIDGTLGPSFLPIHDQSNMTKHPLLDVADIFVWNVARAFGNSPIKLLADETDVHTIICPPMGDEITLGDNI